MPTCGPRRSGIPYERDLHGGAMNRPSNGSRISSPRNPIWPADRDRRGTVCTSIAPPCFPRPAGHGPRTRTSTASWPVELGLDARVQSAHRRSGRRLRGGVALVGESSLRPSMLSAPEVPTGRMPTSHARLIESAIGGDPTTPAPNQRRDRVLRCGITRQTGHGLRDRSAPGSGRAGAGSGCRPASASGDAISVAFEGALVLKAGRCPLRGSRRRPWTGRTHRRPAPSRSRPWPWPN